MEQELAWWQQRFEAACRQQTANRAATGGIGTLREKMLHGAIKHTIEPNSTYHEVPIEGYVADVIWGERIWEVQTGSFTGLTKKLPVFLQQGKVTVVYPVPHHKWLCWVDEETGEVTPKRRSPKTGQPWEIFYELWRIRPLLKEQNLSFQVWLIDVEEYRCLNGWGKNKKRGGARYERRPLALKGIVCFSEPGEYEKLLPPNLPQPFTRKDFAKCAKCSTTLAARAVQVLEHTGLVAQGGKQGRAILYERVPLLNPPAKQ